MSEHNIHMASSHGDGPWKTQWPPNDLEHVASCPICGNAERSLLHEGLIDRVFHCAPGKWSFWSCAACHCAYLDPRPSRASIHRAYDSYFTHQEATPLKSYSSLSPWRKLGRRFLNGYTNFRYSTRKVPANIFGVLVLLILWPLRMRVDREYRHMPRLPAGGGTLLDLGCGNGSFLQVAKSCGWDVVGADPDHKAIARCLKLGLNVHQGIIEQFEMKKELFDIITLSHVIEHVHDPVGVLKACYCLLKPGGHLWLETPNIESLGHRYYTTNWRDLDPPRHLVLFNQGSLTKALTDANFIAIRNKSGPRPLLSITKASEAIKKGDRIDDGIRLSLMKRWIVRKNELQEAIFPASREFLTVMASKGSAMDINS